MANRYWVGNSVKYQSIASQENAPTDVYFKPDGTAMYVVGQQADSVHQYSLSTAWDITTASFVRTRSVSAQETNPNGIFFQSDGTRMYIIGSTGDDITQYSLSTAWDISTASTVGTLLVSARDTQPSGMYISPNGTKLYVVGTANDNVHEYTLSTPWNVISGATYVQSFAIEDVLPQGVHFKDDGTKMYIVGSSGDRVYEYTLGTAWDLSTASASWVSYIVSSNDDAPTGVFFKSDGTQMYVIGSTTDTIYSYPLSTAWSVTSISPDVWDGTAGTKWATTSGGTGGASVPTSADDVFIDSFVGRSIVTLSTGNTGAKSINFTGFIGTFAHSNAFTSNITVSGNVTLSSGMTCTYLGAITFNADASITSAGKTIAGGIIIDGAGITVQLSDALVTSGSGSNPNRGVTVNQGTFTTNNYSVSGFQLVSNTSQTRAINLGSSTVTLSNGGNVVDFSTDTNLTFNAGTSTINLQSNPVTIAVQTGQTFYNVNFNSSGTFFNHAITGTNTFNNLFFSITNNGASQLALSGNQTVNGTLSNDSTLAYQRLFIRSDIFTTSRTITANAISLTNTDFRDITLAGAAAGSSPIRAGDCGGNSGITFPAPKTVYRVGGSNVWENNNWANSSGGAAVSTSFPLPQDTAVIDNNTATTSLSLPSASNLGTVDFLSRSTAITVAGSAGLGFYGNLILGSGVTPTFGGTCTFSGRNSQIIRSEGKSLTSISVEVNTPGGTVLLGDSGSFGAVILTRGTLDAMTYNLSCTSFSSSNSNTRTLNMGSGLWTISGTGNIWSMQDTDNLTLNKGTANILLSSNSTTTRVFNAPGVSFNKLTIGGTGVGGITTIDGNFTELAATKTVAHSVLFRGIGIKVIGVWSITGSSGNVVTVGTETTGTRNLDIQTSTSAMGIDYLNVSNIAVVNPNIFFVGLNSTDSGNNTNVYFTDKAASSNFLFLFM